MSSRITESVRAPSLFPRRHLRRVAELGLLWVLGAMPLAAGCDNAESCQYRCTESRDACPTGLSCDVTLGYCVSEDYTGTCDAETHEVTVCIDEPVELSFPAEGASLSEVEGLPSTAKLEGRSIKGKFSRRATLAFGGPEETRQYWRVNTTDNCPELALDLSEPFCVNGAVDRTIQGTGGDGRLTYELVTTDTEFVLDKNGRLTGTPNEVGPRKLDIAITDARGVRKTSSLNVEISNECPYVEGTLPKSCAEFDYEAPLSILGKAPVEIEDFTPTYRDGKGLSAEEAREVQERLLQAKPVKRDDGYVLQAAPTDEAQGEYVFSVKLKNTLSIEQRDIPFAVRKCDAVKSVLTVCDREPFDIDLDGATDDVWQFYDPKDPLLESLGFTARRIRGKLSASDSAYEVNARVTNALLQVERLVTLTIAVDPLDSERCSDGATNSSDDTDPSILPSGGEVDGGTPPPPPPPLPHLKGCLNEPLKYVPEQSPPNVTNWWSDNLPAGLTINESTGRITGTPSNQGDGSFTVHAQHPGGEHVQQYSFTINENCLFAFKTTNELQVLSLVAGHVLQDPPHPVEVLAPMVLGQADIELFRFSKVGQSLALTTTDALAGDTRAYVARYLGREPASGEPQFNVEALPTFPLPTPVLELQWSDDGQLAMIVEGEGDSSQAALTRRLLTFYHDPQHGWQQRSNDGLAHAHGLAWMGNYPCVLEVDTSFESTTMAVCITPTGSRVEADGPPRRVVRNHSIRTSPTSLLVVASVMDENGVADPNHVLGFDASSDPWAVVPYREVYASPRGDMVAVAKATGDLELAHVGSIFNHPAYTPLGSVPNCDVVTAWSPSGALSCVPTSSETFVTLTTFADNTILNHFQAELPDHPGSRQKAFVDDRIYVFDAGWGRLAVVSLASTPTVSHVELGSGKPQLMAFAAMPMQQTHSRVVVQVEGELILMDLDTLTVQARLSSDSSPLPPVEDCTRSFYLSGFSNWCGGDETSRAFEVSRDANHFLYLTANGELHLSNTDTDAILGNSHCGSAINCSGSFAFAP